jgi:hypothetical protein
VGRRQAPDFFSLVSGAVIAFLWAILGLFCILFLFFGLYQMFLFEVRPYVNNTPDEDISEFHDINDKYKSVHG